MKKISILTFILLVSQFVFAQKDSVYKLKRSIQTGLNVNQASFSDNWKGGGVNTVSIGTFLNAKTNYETSKLSFNNEIQMQYGFQKNKDQMSKKTSDKLFLDTKIGYKFNNKWNLFGSLNFLTQFGDGFSYSKDANGAEVSTLISQFLAPGYLTSSIGMEYRPVKYFWIRFGTGTLRQTFVVNRTLYQNVEKNYGVEINKKMLNEAAFQFIADLDKDLTTTINLKARLNMFANYKTPGNIATRFDMVCTAKITKTINVNLSATALYDENMDYKTQYTQTFALGIMYNFSNF